MNLIQLGVSQVKALSLIVTTLLCLNACSPSNQEPVAGGGGGLPPVSAEIVNPILFVTQVPTDGDIFASRTSTFANHLTSMDSVPRGGDLMIRYPDGSLRNLTKEAGFGTDGQQGASAIAVREPSVHWSGSKALFSMLVGAPVKQYVPVQSHWQLYEVSGLGKADKVSIVKVAGQPDGYNNVSPIYSSDDRVLFTSDRPRNGAAHLYPQLDEYESTATITGIWSLNVQTQQVTLLNHTPSGAFSPQIDSFGRVIFTRWDHLQRDQQADGSPANGYQPQTFDSEAQGAAQSANQQSANQLEVFPESRLGMSSAYGRVNNFTFNLFTPWQMNQDGTSELTINHIGRHELSFGYIEPSFSGDAALTDNTDPSIIANRKYIRMDGGIFHIREDPRAPGIYYGIYAREFGSMTSSQIVRFTGAPSLNAEQMTITDATPADTTGTGLAGGRYRNPLPLSTGQMVAVYTGSRVVEKGINFRLHQLKSLGGNTFESGSSLTPGISKSVTWWSPDEAKTYNGPLWELEPVEVVARARPAAQSSVLEQPERNIFNQEGVSETAFRAWLLKNDLALIVSRNQTSRDRADRQQPYNLQVLGGVKTALATGKVYDIAHYQIFQGQQVRGYQNSSGRRVLAQPIPVSQNPANPAGPVGSVALAPDGSSAAFVPARRALTWQTTDPNGEAVVRERVWVTMQPGEIRTCAGCHGENSSNQIGAPSPTNNPEALRRLLQHWKTLAK